MIVFSYVCTIRPIKVVPSYPNRAGYVPTNIDDFGDGGAFPEIHLVQYPLNMGKPGVKSSAVVTVGMRINSF